MQALLGLLMLLMFIAMPICLVMIIYRAIKKKKKKPFVIGLFGSFIAIIALGFIHSATMTPEEKLAMQQRQEAKKIASEQKAAEQAVVEAQAKAEKAKIAAERASADEKEKADKEAEKAQFEAEKASLTKANADEKASKSSSTSGGIMSFFGNLFSSEKEVTAMLSPEKQKIIYATWFNNVDKDLKTVDSSWNIWKETMTGLSNASMDRFQAYQNLKDLSRRLEKSSSIFINYEIPPEFSDDHKARLSKATNNLALWASRRQKACDKMMKAIDANNIKPSDIDDALSTINKADAAMLEGVVEITAIKKDLE